MKSPERLEKKKTTNTDNIRSGHHQANREERKNKKRVTEKNKKAS